MPKQPVMEPGKLPVKPNPSSSLARAVAEMASMQ